MWILEIVKKLFEVFDNLEIEFEQIDHGSGLVQKTEDIVSKVIKNEKEYPE